MLILGTNAYNPTIMNNTTSGGGSDIPTTLGSRIDNKATVVGVLQDHEGNDYVLAVVDAAYRSDSPIAWSTQTIDTPLINNRKDSHTGKYNTDLILSTYTPTDYPAFNFARNACTVTIGNNTYYSALPNAIELEMLYNNKDVLDQYDPTVNEYTSRSMSNFKCGGTRGLWSSSEGDSKMVYDYRTNGSGMIYKTLSNQDGVCPVICIPLS